MSYIDDLEEKQKLYYKDYPPSIFIIGDDNHLIEVEDIDEFDKQFYSKFQLDNVLPSHKSYIKLVDDVYKANVVLTNSLQIRAVNREIYTLIAYALQRIGIIFARSLCEKYDGRLPRALIDEWGAKASDDKPLVTINKVIDLEKRCVELENIDMKQNVPDSKTEHNDSIKDDDQKALSR